MKKTRLIIMVIMFVLLGGAAANVANAQVYLYYDPFEVADPDIEPTEGEEGPPIVLTTTQAIWAVSIVFGVSFVLALRFFRIRKNKQKRLHMEHRRMNPTITRGAFAATVLLLLLASPIRAQVFLDERSREEAHLRKIESELPVKPKLPSSKNGYVPLGSGFFMLSALGGAYLIGKRGRSQEKH